MGIGSIGIGLPIKRRELIAAILNLTGFVSGFAHSLGLARSRPRPPEYQIWLEVQDRTQAIFGISELDRQEPCTVEES